MRLWWSILTDSVCLRRLLPLAAAVPHVGLPGVHPPAAPPQPPAEKCAKCPVRAHQAHHPPPSTEGVANLLGKGPPPIMAYGAEAPIGGVDIATNVLLKDRMETNIDYLLTSFDVDHLLAVRFFRPTGH